MMDIHIQGVRMMEKQESRPEWILARCCGPRKGDRTNFRRQGIALEVWSLMRRGSGDLDGTGKRHLVWLVQEHCVEGRLEIRHSRVRKALEQVDTPEGAEGGLNPKKGSCPKEDILL